jgi:tetratricopeptide (TPR) repeat protein
MLAPPKEFTEAAAVHTALGTLETRRSRALARYKTALDLDEAYLPAKHNKALALAESGQWKEAVSLWREVLTQDKTFIAARIALAESISANGETKDAIAAFRDLVDSEKDYIAGYRQLAELQSSARDFDGARATLRSAVALSRNPSTLKLLNAELARVDRIASAPR